MAEKESDQRSFAERASTGVRDVSIVIAVLGLIGLAAGLGGATLIFDGAVGAGAGELGRRAAASGKPKSG